MTPQADGSSTRERRQTPRTPARSEQMMEFKLPGSPNYQLKLRDLSETGAGVIVRSESKFLGLVRIGQELRVKLIAPRGSTFQSGSYRGRIAQITGLEEGRYRGHTLVGISLVSED